MRSGELDRRIDIQEQSFVEDDWGERNEAWTTIASVWAKRIEGGGSEFVAGTAEVSKRRVTFEIRWRDDVTEIHRVQFEGDDFDITAIQEIGRRKGLKLLCEVVK